MVTATPSNVVDVLRQLLDQAITSASQQPQHLSDFFKQVESDAQKVVDEVKQIPEDVVNALKEPPFKPPDWWSLLVFLVVHMRDLLDDPRLTVGYRHPAGWSRMLTLNLLSDDPGKVPAATIIASVGVAITDPDVTHGIWLQTVQAFDVHLGGGALQVDISATGNANWQYVIGAQMTKPGQVAHANVDVQWSPYTPDVNFGSGAFTFNLGPLHLGVRLSSAAGDPLYTLTLGLGTGDSGTPGISAGVDAAAALGALSSFVQVNRLDESYSPELVFPQGGSPRFSLGHRGIG